MTRAAQKNNIRAEAENQLDFLDVTVHRKDNKFETSVYRKRTFTGLGLRYDSFVPKSYKINLISCLIHRADEISSNWTNFQRDIVTLPGMLYIETPIIQIW